MAINHTVEGSANLEPRSPEFIASLAKGLAVLRAFGPDRGRMTLADLALETGIPRPGVRRLLITLEELGYIRKRGRHFSLSAKVLEIGFAFLAANNFLGAIEHHLEDTAEELRESCLLAVLQEQEAVCVARSSGTYRLMSISLSVGHKLPAEVTAMGRVLLAALPESDWDMFLKKHELKQYTEHTVTDKGALKEVLRNVGQEGYCIVDQELETSLRTLAVPVLSPQGEVCSALAVSTIAGRVSLDELKDRYLPVLKRSAEVMRPLMIHF